MLKDIGDIRKSSKERANRRWHNHQVERDFKAAKREAAESAAKKPKEVNPADVLEQAKLIKDGTTRFQSKFMKEIRSLLEDHKERNVALYLYSLQIKKTKLLKEKLRRLLVAQQESGGSQ